MLALLLVFVIAICKAVQDSLWHGWGSSVFARGRKPTDYWGDATKVWLRRYVDQERSKGYLPSMRSWWRRQLLVPIWDGWHLVALIRMIATSLLPFSGGMPLWTFPAAMGVHTLVFTLSYNRLRNR